MTIQPLDMRTLLLVGALVCLTIALVMFYYSIARKTYPGFHYWTAGIGSAGLGALLVSLQGHLPAFLAMISGNALIMAMPLMLAHGLATFFGIRRKNTALNLVVFTSYLLGFMWHTYVNPSLYHRIMIFCITMTFFYSEALYFLLKYTKTIFEKQEWILITLLTVSVFSSLFRCTITALHIEQIAFLSNAGWMQCSALLITILSTVGTACSFLILNTYRMENDLQSATRKIENLANVDGLTVLYNRRYFDQRLELETRRQQRNGRPLSLLMADIDSFKPFNDTYGHQAGDECLRNVAAVLKKSGARSSDITARYGGEEFVMLLPDTDEHGAMRVATTVQSGIRELGIRHESSTISDIVTLSIGITTVTPDRRMLPEEIIQLADNALYKSKRNGKNQIQVQTR